MSYSEALNEQLAKLSRALNQIERQILSGQYNCSCYGGPRNGRNCPGCRVVGMGNGFVYDQNPYSYNETPNFFNQPPQHPIETYSCEYCGGSPHPGFDCQTRNTPIFDQGPCYNQDFGYNQPPFYSPSQPQQFDCCEVCGGPHYSSDCQTRNQLVYEPNPGNNYDFPCFDQPPQYHIDPSPPQNLDSHSHCMLLARENNRILEEILRTQMPNSPVVSKEPKGSDDYTEVTYDKEQCLSDHYTAPVTPPAYTPSMSFLAIMEPTDTHLMGDEVISTIPARETNEFIKSSIDDLVPIPRESEVTSDSDLECDMHSTTPLPTTNVREENLDINLPLGEHLDTLSTGERKIDFNPSMDIKELERLLADDPVPVPSMFDEPLGNSDSMSRSSETSDLFEELIAVFGLDNSIPSEIDDRYHDSEGDILYFKQLLNEDTYSDVSPTLLPTESSSLDLPFPNPKQICLR
ncbi:hypothetical protein Tco_0085646 [Tanacetum coccineum]